MWVKLIKVQHVDEGDVLFSVIFHIGSRNSV